MEQARAIVVGGGIMGVSVAYHLARAGWRDVLLVEKGELTSGATCHAMGLVTMFNPSPTMFRIRRASVALYRELGVFHGVGSLRLASSRAQLAELKRGLSRVRALGLEAELLTPREVLDLLPAASGNALHGAVWVPGDGFLDPHETTHALARAARDLGVSIRTGVRVTGVRRDGRGRVVAVDTTDGPIGCEVLVNAAGLWAPQVAAMVGVRLPSTPVDHQHAVLRPVEPVALSREMPCFRDPDYLVYGKAEPGGGMAVGGYEPDPVARWIDGVPWDHGGRSLAPDLDRFAQLLEGAARRFPFVERAEIVRLVCHPDAITPDANPLVGPFPGVPGFYVAAGLSLNGFGGAGGLGEAVAQWIVAGEPELDLWAYRAWRFGRLYHDPVYAAEAAREQYKYYYRLRYPLDQDEWGRPRRLSALHGRLQELGAVFGAKNGWERAEHVEPGRPWRRAGADQRAFGWSTPPWFERVGREVRAFREAVGIVDLSSFGKIELMGPGALPLLERCAANRIDRPVGAVVYTQFLNARGGIVADVTVIRLADERFRVVTGAGTVDADLGWLRMALRPEDGEVVLREASDELAVIGLWGPRAPEVLAAAIAPQPLPETRPMAGGWLTIAGAAVWAQEVSYVGEAGWELYVDPGWAVAVWDRLVAVGREAGMEPCGYRAIDAARLECGYRYMGVDLTPLDTPAEVGLERFVALDKGPFIGREALRAAAGRTPDHRLVTLAIGDGGYVTVYGGESVLAGGEIVGRLRSCAYGYTVGQMLATAKVPAALGPGAELAVDVMGERIPARIVADPVVAPSRRRPSPATSPVVR
jgi:glycine cleavage system aminomethyltransferase T/glycine/D-amino acid oxidase-like deaminating enzyme